MCIRRAAVAPLALVVLALGLAPASARAQLLPGFGGAQRGGGLSPVAAARLGWSIRDSSPSAGVQLRLPLPIPALRPAVTVGGDVVFQTGLEEVQGTADLTLGMFAPLYAGGGPALLNSIFGDAADRETKLGFTLVGGIGGGRVGPLLTQLEFRWLRVDELSPRFFMLTLGYPLFGF
jgi:hypothetical protein